MIETALDFAARRNGAAFSLRELASALGVSHAAVYRHFPDRDSLLDELAAIGFRRLAHQQEQEQKNAGDDELERLYTLGTAYVRFARQNAGLISLMFSPELKAPSGASDRKREDDRAFDNLRAAIASCQQSGRIIAGDPDKIAAHLVLSTHGLALYQMQGDAARFSRDFEDEAFGARVLRIAVAPFLTSPPSPDEVAELLR